MKYTLEIEIAISREKMITLFDSVENLQHWQEGFVSFEHLSGPYGETGGVALLKYNNNGKVLELTETITGKNLPDGFSAIYEAPMVWNRQKNYFIEMGPDKTKWVADHDFKFTSFMRIIGFLLPSVFKKQSYKFMEAFKAFAEAEINL